MSEMSGTDERDDLVGEDTPEGEIPYDVQLLEELVEHTGRIATALEALLERPDPRLPQPRVWPPPPTRRSS